ncbi:MAG: TolC family protein, partial [Nitrospiraceae bacterium]
AVKEVRSRLLPQLDIGTGGAIIDDDRARAGAGSAPERSWTGQATLSQLLYSDSVWTAYAVEKHVQDSRVDVRNTIELDIAQAAAVAYLNVLRAESIEEIQKNNLRLTRANLERARVRVNVGIAGPDEVYRWESQIADNRQIVLRSESDTFNAKNSLNRILNRPLQEPFVAEEADLEAPPLGSTNELFHDLITHPKDFLLFRDFLVMKGLEISPELRRFDAEIAARERIMVSAKRAFWLPDVSLQGNVTELFSEGGEGQRSDSPADINDTDWTVGVFATLPLFTSGQKTATYSRTRHELDRIRIDREAARERIEQRILSAVNLTRSSYPAIELSRDAGKAAQENLTLVSDSYERGIKSIIDLIDAQNQALVSDQRAANSVYDFLIDFMNVLRAVGSFDFLLSETGREEWLQDFRVYAVAEAETNRK